MKYPKSNEQIIVKLSVFVYFIRIFHNLALLLCIYERTVQMFAQTFCPSGTGFAVDQNLVIIRVGAFRSVFPEMQQTQARKKMQKIK